MTTLLVEAESYLLSSRILYLFVGQDKSGSLAHAFYRSGGRYPRGTICVWINDVNRWQHKRLQQGTQCQSFRRDVATE